MSKTISHSREAERRSIQHHRPCLSASVSSARSAPDPTPSSGARKGEISDYWYRTIINLFATRFVHSTGYLRNSDPSLRYIKTFDKDHLALEGAYTSEATFSCRFISSSRSPLPYHFTKCNTGILQGPSNIIQALSSFSRCIAFVPPESPLDVTIDILQLPDMSYFTTLTFNTIIEGVDVSVDMVFVLKEYARLTGKQVHFRELWTPFVVVSHQMILRD